MAPYSEPNKSLTEYERQRLENIRRNQEMMSALVRPNPLTTLNKPANPKPFKRAKLKPEPKTTSPIIIRRSLRTRGVPPSENTQLSTPESSPARDPSPRKRGPLSINESSTDEKASDAIIDVIKKSSSGTGRVESGGIDPRRELGLRSENVAKVVSERIFSVGFVPVVDRTVVVVGNKVGSLGIWDVDCENEEDGICVFEAHSSPVSGISMHPFSPRKIYTCSYDGYMRLMDIEKETFNMLYSSDYLLYSICQWPQDINSVYIGEAGGMLKVWDVRAGKTSNFYELHEARINTIDFNPQNSYLMTTSSTDGLACIWDLRNMENGKLKSIQTIRHGRAAHSSYFSPSGKYLATTSADDTVGIASGANYSELSMVSHNNWTGRWLSSFRAIWGWDDSYIFIGNMKRAIDVISTSYGTTSSLVSEEIMTSIPCRFAAHPYKLGHLAGATSGGKVFLWTKE